MQENNTLNIRINIHLKEEFEVPSPSLIDVKDIANEAFAKYLKHKKAKIKDGACFRSINLLRGSYASGMKKSVIKEYKLLVIYSMLDNLEINSKIPIKSINEFSIQYFGTPIDNNEIYRITKNKKYEHLFIKYFNRKKSHSCVFNLSKKDAEKIGSNVDGLIEYSLEVFKSNKGE